jgi:hypothetical protein
VQAGIRLPLFPGSRLAKTPFGCNDVAANTKGV